MSAELLPLGTPVVVTIEGKIVGRTEGNTPPVLYQVESDDGRTRWVPYYNVEKRDAG